VQRRVTQGGGYGKAIWTRRLLDYLKATKVERYRKVVKDLGLRR